MAETIWKYAQNTFDTSTRDSHVKMLSIATDTEAKLEAENSDPDINLLYTGYVPVYNAYRQICINYDVMAGNREGSTLNLETMLLTDLPKEIRKWEAQVRIIYVEDSPNERAIFPNKRNPFLQGTYEDRISAVGTLAARLADDSNATLVAYAPTVLSYYNMLLSARDGQQVVEGTLNLLSATREQQRKLVATELYGALGGLMRKFKADPPQIMRFFDMSLLRETGEDENILASYELTIPIDTLVDVGAWEEGTTAMRVTLISGGTIRASRSLDGTVVDGVPIVLATPGTETKAAEDFQINGMHVVVENQSTTAAAVVKVELLG